MRSSTPTPSDLELLGAWRSGDEAAGNTLFERHFDALYRFFENKVGDGVDDLVQQTMLGCVRGLDGYREHASFRTYVFAIARNVLYKHLELRCRDGARFDPNTSSIADFGESPSYVAAARTERRVLAAALRRIPVDDQIALELYYWEDLTGPELAQALDLTEPAVRSRLRRALERLRRMVTELTASPTELESVSVDLDRWAAALRDRDSDHD
jgi:RNA polymerase sigma-70 factor (ECF subfamily)